MGEGIDLAHVGAQAELGIAVGAAGEGQLLEEEAGAGIETGPAPDGESILAQPGDVAAEGGKSGSGFRRQVGDRRMGRGRRWAAGRSVIVLAHALHHQTRFRCTHPRCGPRRRHGPRRRKGTAATAGTGSVRQGLRRFRAGLPARSRYLDLHQDWRLCTQQRDHHGQARRGRFCSGNRRFFRQGAAALGAGHSSGMVKKGLSRSAIAARLTWSRGFCAAQSFPGVMPLTVAGAFGDVLVRWMDHRNSFQADAGTDRHAPAGDIA